MYEGSDLTPWDLVADGVTGAIDDGVEIRVPHLEPLLGGALRFRLVGVRRIYYQPRTDRWDEPSITDRAELGALALPLDDVIYHNAIEIRRNTPRGYLIVDYDELHAEAGRAPIDNAQLARAIETYWADWCANASPDVHPTIREALVEPWTDVLLERLVIDWRDHRTSELAQTIQIVDASLHPGTVTFRGVADVPGWSEGWRTAEVAAIRALADCARSCFDVDLETTTDGLAMPSKIAAERFRAITHCLAAIDGDGDPRIGRGLERLLRSPSDHYFYFGEASGKASEPCFAERLIPLLVAHADAGSVDRLDEAARVQSIEADCNGAEMASKLREIAGELAKRYPDDRVLGRDIVQALRMRRPS